MLNFELLEAGHYRLTSNNPNKRLKLALFLVGGEAEIVELVTRRVSLGVNGSDFTAPLDSVESVVIPASVSVQAHRLIPGTGGDVQHFDSLKHKVEIIEVPKETIACNP